MCNKSPRQGSIRQAVPQDSGWNSIPAKIGGEDALLAREGVLLHI